MRHGAVLPVCCIRGVLNSLFPALWWGSARLHHFLGDVKLDTGNALVLGKGKVGHHGVVAHIRCVCVSCLVHTPLVFAGVGVSSTDVLGLQVLELAVQVGAVHGRLWSWFVVGGEGCQGDVSESFTSNDRLQENRRQNDVTEVSHLGSSPYNPAIMCII